MIDTVSMQRLLVIRRAIALRADQFAPKAEELGSLAAQAISGDSGRSQLTGLEAVAQSTLKIADILDYIKLRVGRHETWRKDDFGLKLLSFLQEGIRSKPSLALQPPLDDAERHQVTLQLMREFIRQMTVHYEFARMQMGGRR